ncbi:MAG: ComEC/Rec2 family competence protein [Eubacterium sp.]|nr:ComEC/Rec2 family competence protein [Eubacterium sp.]
MKRVFAHIGFSFAITLIVLNVFSIDAAFVILGVTGAAFAVSMIFDKLRKGASIPLCAASAFLACVLFLSVYYGTFIPQSKLDGKTANAEFYIIDFNENAESGRFYYTVKTISVDLDGAPQSFKTEFSSDERLSVDYYLLIKGELTFHLSAENGFDSYGDFGEGIFLSSKLNFYQITNETISSPNKYVLHIRDSIKAFIEREFDRDRDGLILALLIGDKTLLSGEVKNNFIVSGTSHIMAVSGLHLAVLSGSLYWLLKKMRTPKVPAVMISVISTCFYMALCGFSKSITRAGIMMLILLLGKLFDEKSDSLNSLGLAVFIICLNPFAVTDSGALLTVTAVLGLITVNKELVKLFKPKSKLAKSKLAKYTVSALLASVSVFITTLPVLYATFGYVSVIGVFLNIVMIPIAQFTMITAFLATAFQWLAPLLFVFKMFAGGGAGAMLFITEKCAQLPFALRNISTPAIGLAIAAALLLFGIVFIIGKKNLLKPCAAISLVLAVAILSVSAAMEYNSVFVREIGGYYTTAVVVYDRNNAVIIGVNDYQQYSTAKIIVKTNGLNVSMIIDTSSSDYSKRLTRELDVLNYVTDGDAQGINCSNIVKTSDFTVDLWQSLNVKYYHDGRNAHITFKVYNNVFRINGGKMFESGEGVINTRYLYEHDVLYTVNEYGISERRLNLWLK